MIWSAVGGILGAMNDAPRQVLCLNDGWRFHLGDIDAPLANTHIAAYMNNKAGYARGGAKPSFDDSDWRVVQLPHDWAIEGEIRQEHHVNAGFRPRGIGWYRRHFELSEADRDRVISLRFEGVATHCTVYVNAHLLHRHFTGYTPFTIDISDVANFGPEVNTIAVRVDATYMEGWWYEGAGIYRDVKLIKTHRIRIVEDSMRVVCTESQPGRWMASVQAEVVSTDPQMQRVDQEVILLTDGEPIARAEDMDEYARGDQLNVAIPLRLRDPRLWSVESPYLYEAKLILRIGARVVDEQSVFFGFRSFRFDAERGFFLNDKPLKLKGACIHQDHAGVGVAVPASVDEYRVRRLKEMGINAIRPGHHPPSLGLLDACDRLGMFVLDENRNFGSSPEHLAQLTAMVKRDRHRACVFAWCLCNEEAIQGTNVSRRIAQTMAEAVRDHDLTRPITAAISGGILNDDCSIDAIDMMGINYQPDTYDAFHAKRPTMPLFGSENNCALGTRGEYHTDLSRYFFASDDSEKAFWGQHARQTWRMVSERPFVAGLFIWTGFDYRGEPSPHAWPCVTSHWGVMDLCGFAKDLFYLHKAHFTRAPFVHLLPHWTLDVAEGTAVKVSAFTNVEECELLLNGSSLGRKPVDPIDMASWEVPYERGRIEAVGYRDGIEVARAQHETTGPAVALGLELDASAVSLRVIADGQCAVPVTVYALDADGRRVPTASSFVVFELAGPGRIIGVGNGDPTCHESDKLPHRSLFNGLAQCIVQTTTDAGKIVLTATSAGLAPASLTLESAASLDRGRVPLARRRIFLNDWRMSPITANAPDLSVVVSDSDMNSWQRIAPGKPQSQWSQTRGYAVYECRFTPPAAMQREGARIVFHGLNGAMQMLVDGAASDGRLSAAPGPRVLRVLVHGENAQAGLVGRVELVPLDAR